MATLDERVARLEGIIEQINERLADLQAQMQDLRAEIRDLRGETRDLRAELREKADRRELRLWVFTILSVQGLVVALLGVVLARLP